MILGSMWLILRSSPSRHTKVSDSRRSSLMEGGGRAMATATMPMILVPGWPTSDSCLPFVKLKPLPPLPAPWPVVRRDDLATPSRCSPSPSSVSSSRPSVSEEPFSAFSEPSWPWAPFVCCLAPPAARFLPPEVAPLGAGWPRAPAVGGFVCSSKGSIRWPWSLDW